LASKISASGLNQTYLDRDR